MCKCNICLTHRPYPELIQKRFHCNRSQHKIRKGEEIHDIFDYVEDTKGNPNDRGRLMVTSLRLIWYSTTNPKFNLCAQRILLLILSVSYSRRISISFSQFRLSAIGYNCILTMSTKTVLSKVRGTTLAMYILTLCHNSRFEFIFTNLSQSNAKKFSSIFDVYR